MNQDWNTILNDSVTTAKDLVDSFNIEEETAKKLKNEFNIRINSYYRSLIKYPGDPIWLQVVPDIKELEEDSGLEDPLGEENQSPVPNITHRYPNRALFLVSSQCGIYCRFCTRKRKVGDPAKISLKHLESAFQYLEEHTEIQDVILSGGDPLLLSDAMLEKIIKRLRTIKHILVIRIGTKLPCVLPQRITPELCDMLKKYHPIYINTHFNHPSEITEESSRACNMLADAGIPMGCQTVLMKGVNDNAEVMKELMMKLVAIRVKPYYIYQIDLVKGTKHLRTPIETGLNIMRELRGNISGIATPQFIVDLPNGGGKTPMLPEYVVLKLGNKYIFKNYKNEIFEYEDYS